MKEKSFAAELTTREKKCLASVYEIYRLGKAPSFLGAAIVVMGEEEGLAYQGLATFGCLSSLTKRKAKTHLRALVKKGYLEERMPLFGEESYLLVTPKGRMAAEEILSKPIRKSASRKERSPLFIERNKL